MSKLRREEKRREEKRRERQELTWFASTYSIMIINWNPARRLPCEMRAKQVAAYMSWLLLT
jgi:hypothetical protein